jgi:hypothetical protein
MIARQQDVAELAKQSNVTKAEAREERQAELKARGKVAGGGGDGEEGTSGEGHAQ